MADKKIEIGPYYQKRAKELTDFLFDKGFLADDLTRESIDALEEYFGFLFEWHCEMAVRGALFTKTIRERDAAKKESG